MYDINNFPEWLTIVDLDEPNSHQFGGEQLSDSSELNTERLQLEIKNLFQQIENEKQDGGKKKKKSSKTKKSKKSKKSSKSGGPLDNYKIALEHISKHMKLGKSVKDRAPARAIIKLIEKELDASLSGEEKYKKINEIFDSNPEKYIKSV